MLWKDILTSILAALSATALTDAVLSLTICRLREKISRLKHPEWYRQ